MPRVQRNPLPAPMRVEDIRGESAVFHVKNVLVDVKSDRNRQGRVTVIIPVENEKKGLYLNATSIDAAIEGFGSEMSEDWIGKPFPVIKVFSEFEDKSGKTVSAWKLWIAPAENWAKLMPKSKAR